MLSYRIFVEKHGVHAKHKRTLLYDIRDVLGITGIADIRYAVYYNIFGAKNTQIQPCLQSIFGDISQAWIYTSLTHFIENSQEIAKTCDYCDYISTEYLPGQYDQRADAAEQGLHLLGHSDYTVTTGQVILLYQYKQPPAAKQPPPCHETTAPPPDDESIQRIISYIVNPVEMKITTLENPPKAPVYPQSKNSEKILHGFIAATPQILCEFKDKLAIALDVDDLEHIQKYYKNEKMREPTVTEIKFLDTYWSDHCRHTTFLTSIETVEFPNNEDEAIQRAWSLYKSTREIIYTHEHTPPPVSLMNIATIASKFLRRRDAQHDIDNSEEVNACSIKVPITINNKQEQWLLMFKNETHNHPTEIEPYGGASTCLGGAIRDPLSGRSYVFASMRITGAAEPREAVEDTLSGKLPQRLITTKAAKGFSAYGNEIGLACPYVKELYHPGYKAKRLEAGFVMGAAPKRLAQRQLPIPGDIILLVGGRTGRDGIGGAVGSSKTHTDTSLETCAAEVQKGNPVEERKIQRLFRNPAVAPMIKRCNDFGAGGVCVAVGEIADGVEITLDAIPLKYSGLDGMEIALSESQERMAVVISPQYYEIFRMFAHEENLETTIIAKVIHEKKILIKHHDKILVDIPRNFLDTMGAQKTARAIIPTPAHSYVLSAPWHKPKLRGTQEFWNSIELSFSSLRGATQIGLQTMFDSTVGAATVLMPYGGTYQTGQEEGAAVLFPVSSTLFPDSYTGKKFRAPECSTAALSAASCPLKLLEQSPFHGAAYAVVDSLAKLAAMGANPLRARLSFQEYFRRMDDQAEHWGQPLSALLGAFEAQIELGVPAIGGKDSMSGSFNNLHVPPTFISFAVTTEDVSRVRSTQIEQKDMLLYLLLHIPHSDGSPNYKVLADMWKWMYSHASSLPYAATVGERGVIQTIINMVAGNNLGCDIDISEEFIAAAGYGSMIVASNQTLDNDFMDTSPVMTMQRSIDNTPTPIFVGKTKAAPIIKCKVPERGMKIWKLSDILHKQSLPLESIFPSTINQDTSPHTTPLNTTTRGIKFFLSKNNVTQSRKKPRVSLAHPRVCIPVFPGTNCEYDTLHAFESAGAVGAIPVFRNKTKRDILDSLDLFGKHIAKSNILCLAGGFSAADEPDGAGKFIALILQAPAIKTAILNMLYKDGLILGICNGFQALLKSGWLPFSDPTRYRVHPGATLTANQCGHHVSRIVGTKILRPSASPWLSLCEVGKRYFIPVSHGEGRFVTDAKTLKKLVNNNQVASVYETNQNPNGSEHNIEGIISKDGKIFGRMGHIERVRPGLYKNIPGIEVQPIIKSGVEYFL